MLCPPPYLSCLAAFLAPWTCHHSSDQFNILQLAACHSQKAKLEHNCSDGVTTEMQFRGGSAGEIWGDVENNKADIVMG